MAFGYEDAVAPAKIITEYAKKNKKISVKCGLVDQKVIDVDVADQRFRGRAFRRAAFVRVRCGSCPQAEGRGINVPLAA